MFESILERLLTQYGGQFIDGIDKDNLNLGVWSGSIIIQNVRVKPSVFDVLELPFKIKYSHIGKLMLKVPWKSLGSSPVDLQMEDIFLILIPVDSSHWEPIDFKNIDIRMKLIESFTSEITNKILEAQKQQDPQKKKTEDGYVAKLTEKIIDNIQITFKNIHIRFENVLSNRKYAFGLTLDELQLFTANQKWEKQYIDRTDKKFKLEPLRKRLLLQSLGVYWNSDTKLILADETQEKTTNKMKELVLKDDLTHDELTYLISVSASSRIVQKSLKNPATKDDPNLTVELKLQPLNLNLQKNNLEDIVRLLEFLGVHGKFKADFARKRYEEIRNISETKQKQNLQRFKVLFEKMQRAEKKDDFKGEEKIKQTLKDPQEIKEFNFLIQAIHDEDLAAAVKEVIKALELERQKKEIEDKNSSRGFFSMFSSKPKNAVISQDEISKLENFLDDTLTDDKEDTSEQFASQKTMILNFLLDGGNISLLNQAADKTIEGVTFGYKELKVYVEQRNKGQKIQVSLKEVGLFLKTKYLGSKDFVVTPIMQKVDYFSENSKTFLAADFEINPIGKEEGTYINVTSQALELVYRPISIQRITEFFAVTTDEETLKAAAREQYEKAQDTAKMAAQGALKTSQKSKLKISANLASPVIVIPFLQNGDVKSACWVIQLGDLSINTRDSQEEKYYDIFEIKLSGTNYKYYPSQAIFIKAKESLVKSGRIQLEGPDEEEYANVFDVLEDFSLSLSLKQLNAEMIDQAIKKPQIDVDLKISGIHLKLKPQIYNYLLNTAEFISYKTSTQVEFQENDRKVLMQGMEKIGRIYHREKKYNDTVWATYYAILKGGYLYFFRGPTDIRPAFALYVKTGKVALAQNVGRDAAFTIEKGQTISYLACETPKETEDWINAINKKLNEYSLATQSVYQKQLTLDDKSQKAAETEKQAKTKKDYNQVTMSVNVSLKEFKFTIYRNNDRNDTRELIDFKTNFFSFSMVQRPGDMEMQIRLQSLQMHDYLFSYTNPNLRDFLTSAVPETYQKEGESAENIDLFEVSVKTMAKDHPRYAELKKIDLDISLRFGYLFLNLKPDVIEALLIFLTANLPKKHEAQTQSKSQGPNAGNSLVAADGSETKELDQAMPGKVQTIYSQTDNTLMRVNVRMKQIGLRMVHRRLQLCLGELSLKDSDVGLEIKPQATYFHGRIGNMQLLETTNYPFTTDSNVEYHKIKPYELLGVHEKGVSLLEINFKSFDPQSGQGDLERRIFNFVEINVSSIGINVLQLPLLRIVNFFTSQLVGALTEGNKAQGQTEQISRDMRSNEPPKMTKWQAQDSLSNPVFMDIKLKINSPLIKIQPLPESEEGIEIKLGNVSINNQQIKNKTRYEDPVKPLDFVYCEQMKINVSDMGIWKIQDGKKTELARKFELKADLERLLFSDEYEIIYGADHDAFALDSTIILNANLTPLMTIVAKDDYRLIMKILSHNISYSDELNELFDWSAPKKEVPKMSKAEAKMLLKQTTVSETSKANPILLNLKLQNIGLVVLEEKSGLPLTMLNIHLIHLKFKSDEDKNTLIQFLIHDIKGSFFEKTKDSNLIQRNLLGSLEHETTHEIVASTEETTFKVIEKVEAFTSDLLQNEPEDNEFQFTLELKMAPSGNKSIEINLLEFKSYLITSAYLSLANFAALDDSVKPPPPKTEIQNRPDTQLMRKQTTKLESEVGVVASFSALSVKVILKNLIITMPSSTQKTNFTPQVLTIRGDLGLTLDTFAPPNFREAQKLWSTKKFVDVTVQATKNNRTMKILMTLNKFEIFISDFEDVINNQEFANVRKRNIIMPFSLLLLRETFSILNSKMTKLIAYNRTKVELEKFILRVSYNDFVLLFSSINYQLEQLSASSQQNTNEKHIEPEKKEELVPKQQANHKVINLEESKKNDENVIDSNFDEYLVSDQGLQITLINDTQNTFVPVLEVSVVQMGVEAMLSSAKTGLKGKIVFGITYYNPRSSHWEPIIEKFGLDYEIKTGQQLSPKTSIILGTNENFMDLNINLSNDMIETLLSTSHTWKNEIDETRKTIKHQKSIKETKSDKDYIEYVSPYVIKNGTGYQLEISSDNSKEKKKENEAAPRLLRSKSIVTKSKLLCDNGSTVSYLQEVNLDQLFGENTSDYNLNPNRIKFSVLHDSFDFEPVEAVNLHSNNSSKRALQWLDSNGKKSSEIYHLVTQVEYVSNKRVFSILSPVQIRNNLPVPLKLHLVKDGGSVQLTIDSNEVVAVPFDYIKKGKMTILDEKDSSVQGLQASILDYISSKKKYFEISVGSKHCILKPIKDEEVTYLEFNTAFTVKNCCPLPINYQISAQEPKTLSFKLKSQESHQILDFSRKESVKIKVSLEGHEWSEESVIYPQGEHSTLDKILINGTNGSNLTIDVHTVSDEYGSYRTYFYCKAVIVNETLLDLLYYSCEDKKETEKKILPGQYPQKIDEDHMPKILLYGGSKRLAIATKDAPKAISTSFVPNVLGDQTVILEDLGQSKAIEFGINISLITADKENFLYTNIIAISPRYIFINKLKENIRIKRPDQQTSSYIIAKGVRTPFEWLNYSAKQQESKEISLRILDENDKEKWNWTGALDITAVGVVNLLVRSTNKSNCRFLRIKIISESSIIYVEIDEQTPDDSSLRVQNDVENIDIVFYQTCVKASEGFKIMGIGSLPYAWHNPTLTREIYADFQYGSKLNFHSSVNKYSFDHLHKVSDIVFPVSKNHQIKIRSQIEVHGNTRILRFYSQSEGAEKKKIEEIINISFHLNLKGIGLSLIAPIEKKKVEVLYVSMKGIEVGLVQSNLIQATQLRIKYINIDNNSAISTLFPVVFTPSMPKELLNLNSKNFFIDFAIQQNTESAKIPYYNYIKLLLSGTTVRVDGTLIQGILSFVIQLTETLSKYKDQENSSYIEILMSSKKESEKEKLKSKEYFEELLPWRKLEIKESQGNLFIEEFEIQPIFLSLSFHLQSHGSSTKKGGFFVLNVLTNVLGSALANVDQAPLNLSGIKLENVFDDQKAIVEKVSKKYTNDAIKQAYKILGSIDILGNPVGLFNNISTGVVDLFEKPRQGFNQGVLEGGYGIVLGAGSLVKNTISGVFNSISGVSGSLAGGLSSITMDDEYMEQRDLEKMDHPKNVAEGLGQGLLAILSGVVRGVSGVVVKPYKGARNQGVKGFFRGTWQGVSGLAIKPVAGALDAVSKTSEGIKNTATSFDEKPNQNRQRYPRPFYGTEQFYRSYLVADAEVIYLLQIIDEEKYQNASLLYTFNIYPNPNNKEEYNVLVLTVEKIIYWNANHAEVIWEFPSADLDEVNQTTEGVAIHLKKLSAYVKEKVIKIENPKGRVNNMIAQKLNELMILNNN